jgi:hypothetical protein
MDRRFVDPLQLVPSLSSSLPVIILERATRPLGLYPSLFRKVPLLPEYANQARDQTTRLPFGCFDQSPS